MKMLVRIWHFWGKDMISDTWNIIYSFYSISFENPKLLNNNICIVESIYRMMDLYSLLGCVSSYSWGMQRLSSAWLLWQSVPRSIASKHCKPWWSCCASSKCSPTVSDCELYMWLWHVSYMSKSQYIFHNNRTICLAFSLQRCPCSEVKSWWKLHVVICRSTRTLLFELELRTNIRLFTIMRCFKLAALP